jgi:hypothetical protein
MKQNLARYLRAFVTISSGIGLAFAIGAFMATPVNPAEFREMHAKIDAAVQAGTVFRGDKAEDMYFTVSSQPVPPYFVAVLDWHAWLIAPSLVLAFLAFRPALIPSIVIVGLATVFMHYFVTPNAALILLAASCLGMLGGYGLGTIQSRATREAA